MILAFLEAAIQLLPGNWHDADNFIDIQKKYLNRYEKIKFMA